MEESSNDNGDFVDLKESYEEDHMNLEPKLVEEFDEEFDEDVHVEELGERVGVNIMMENNENGLASHESECRNDGLKEKLPAPEVGMVFSTWEEADSYYRMYGMQEGFGVFRVTRSYGHKVGEAPRSNRRSTWKCRCFHSPNHRKRVNRKIISTDCGCPVMMYATTNKDMEWKVRKVVTEHRNHNLIPQNSYRQEEWRKLRNNHATKVSKVCSSLAEDGNGVGNMTITGSDLYNVLSKQKRLKLQDGDAKAMMELYNKMAADQQNFFHMYRLYDKGCLKDVIFVDARCRVAYEEFGDVVYFDTTYLTNEYELPLANFVGVNHHGQTIVLGCALVSLEDTDTLEWLFSTWLLCMGEKSPVSILTDQDAAMRKTLSRVMPESHHRWCLWLILQKFSKKLDAYERYQEFKDVLHDAIYDSLKAEEFEINWTSAVYAYHLDKNKWLSGMHI